MKKLIAGVCIILATLTSYAVIKHTTKPPLAPVQTVQITPNIKTGQTTCHINGVLPDSNCTPGVVRTTDINIICHQGTKQFRPSVSYTNPLKIQSIKEYGYSDTNPSDYEYDHLISLELGGDGYDTKNLWAEPHTSSFQKDQIENKLHAEICSGKITAQDAQKEISTNWTQTK